MSCKKGALLLLHFLSFPLNFSGPIHFPCQVQEDTVYDPFLLFSANLKRDLADEQPYRRTLRELGLSCSSVWVPGRWEAKALHLGHRLAGYLSGGAGWDLLVATSTRLLPSQGREPSAA